MKKLSRQDLIDLVDGAAIFSAGGGEDPEVGHKIVDALSEGNYEVKLVDHPETGKCVTAEKIINAQKLAMLGIPAPEKWRTREDLELWRDVLQRSHVSERCVPIEQLNR